VSQGFTKPLTTESELLLSDVTTADSSTTKHGLSSKVVAPPAGTINVLGVENGETVRSDKAASASPGAAAKILQSTTAGLLTLVNLILSALTASTLIYSNASKQITSLANAAGYLLNDGVGGLSWAAISTSYDKVCCYSSAQSIGNGANTTLLFDNERYDTNNMHYTSAANLTGTVTKTATSAALVGSGTSFTTELSVGQVISVPGTAAEKRVVTVITDNTHLTVSTAFAYSASGQTATRVNSAIVFRTAGYYSVGGLVVIDGNATGVRSMSMLLNNTTYIASDDRSPPGTFACLIACVRDYQFAQWDFVELQIYQNSGGSLNSQYNANYSPEFFAHQLP
jgi:hypothetical protein